jgi:hypothetical protein
MKPLNCSCCGDKVAEGEVILSRNPSRGLGLTFHWTRSRIWVVCGCVKIGCGKHLPGNAAVRGLPSLAWKSLLLVGIFTLSSLAEPNASFLGADIRLGLNRKPKEPGITLTTETSAGGATLLWARGENVSTNDLKRVARLVIATEGYRVRDSQMLEAILAFEREYLPILVAKGLVRSNSMDITWLSDVLETVDDLNRDRLVASRQVMRNGECMREHFVVRANSSDGLVAYTRGRDIFVDLEAALKLAKQDEETWKTSLRTAFVDRLVEILQHERMHGLTEMNQKYSPVSSPVRQLFKQHGVLEELYYVTLIEWTAQLGTIAQSCSLELEFVEAYEHCQRLLPLRRAIRSVPFRMMGELYPGYLITVRLSQDKNLAAYLVAQESNEFQQKNHRLPADTEVKAFERAALDKVSNHTLTREEYRGFLQQIPDEDKRLWARGVYEQYLGRVPELNVDVPQELLQWFELETGQVPPHTSSGVQRISLQ